MKLYYIANFRMPTEKAHGYQVAKTCEVFAKSKILSTKHEINPKFQTQNSKLEVELIIPTRRNNIKQDVFEYYGLERSFKITSISVPDFIAMTPPFLRKGGFFLQSFFYLIKLFWWNFGAEFSDKNSRRGRAIRKKSLLLANGAKEFLEENSEPIVYSRNPEIIWLFSLRGYKTVFESHRFPRSKICLHIFLVKKAAKIITVTKKLAELYKNAGINAGNILVAPDGVDLSVFDIDVSKEDARRRLDLPAGAILLGYTGEPRTMGVEKGFDCMMEAVTILQSLIRTNKRIVLCAVGGDEEKKLDNLIMVKRVDRKRLAVYQKAFDILLMPFPKNTHYSYYMSPLKMFEYMAAKRPIVASDLPSVREVLNKSNAVLVKPDDPKSLAEGILKIINDPQFALSIAEKAYEDSKKYTWEKRAELIINFIRL